jgi:cAMP-dependent protein kinase regulator
MAPPASWTDVLNELNRDVAKEQPQDVVQFGADWFQARLKKEVKHRTISADK